METTLENWLCKKVDQHEKMQDYSVAIETIRLWIDEYNEFEKCRNSPFYFFNNYLRRDGEREMTEEEFESFVNQMNRPVKRSDLK